MTYEYHCHNSVCLFRFDVMKSVREMEKEELCPRCLRVAERVFIPRAVYFSGTKVESAEYNPGLGCIVKSSAHRKQIAKEKGLIELGNEKVDSLHSHYDKARAEKWDSGWAEATKGWVGEG